MDGLTTGMQHQAMWLVSFPQRIPQLCIKCAECLALNLGGIVTPENCALKIGAYLFMGSLLRLALCPDRQALQMALFWLHRMTSLS